MGRPPVKRPKPSKRPAKRPPAKRPKPSKRPAKLKKPAAKPPAKKPLAKPPVSKKPVVKPPIRKKPATKPKPVGRVRGIYQRCKVGIDTCEDPFLWECRKPKRKWWKPARCLIRALYDK